MFHASLSDTVKGDMHMRKYLWFLLFVPFLASCVGGMTEIIQIGKDTYMVSNSGNTAAPWAATVGSLKIEMYKRAKAYCLKLNKRLQPVSTQSRGAGFDTRPEAELHFRCLRENETYRPKLEPVPDTIIQDNRKK